jgi:hypothetical protein
MWVLMSKLSLGKKLKWFNPLRDNIPRGTTDSKFILYDNYGQMIGAHKANSVGANIFIANLQLLMSRSLLLWLLNKNDSMLYLYNMAKSIVIWASKKYEQTKDSVYLPFLPTFEKYGERTWSPRYLNSHMRFAAIINKRPAAKLTPPGAYTIEDAQEARSYDPSKSPIYQFDGSECQPFTKTTIEE